MTDKDRLAIMKDAVEYGLHTLLSGNSKAVSEFRKQSLKSLGGHSIDDLYYTIEGLTRVIFLLETSFKNQGHA